MPVFYGGLACLDPLQEALNCEELEYPTRPWLGQANGFVCPLGIRPGRGRVLMLRRDLNRLSPNTLYDLAFHDGQRVVTLKQLLFVRSFNVSGGYRGDPQAAVWLEVADRRALCQWLPIDKAYNIRGSPGGSYFSATLNGGVAWTWSQLVQDLWTAVGKLGTWPGLPTTPDGTPEGWAFWGQYALDALGTVLDRLSLALRYDPTTDIFTVVSPGATDSANSQALTQLDSQQQRIWDADPVESVRGKLPAGVRILFPRQRATLDATGASPWEALDRTDPSAGGPLSGTETGTKALIFDDLPALYDLGGSLTNATALGTRADERASDYFRRQRPDRLARAYTGARTTGLLPGKQLKATRWADRGNGVITDVVWLPGMVGDRRQGKSSSTWDYPLWDEPAEKDPVPTLSNRLVAGTGMLLTPGGIGEQEVLVLSSTGGSGGSPVTVTVVTQVCPLYTSGQLSGVTVERRVLTLPAGTTVGDKVCTDNPSSCCDVVTPCDPTPVAHTLSATFTFTHAGTMDCIDGQSVPLVYDGVSTWTASVPCNGHTLAISFFCNSLATGWKMNLGCDGIAPGMGGTGDHLVSSYAPSFSWSASDGSINVTSPASPCAVNIGNILEGFSVTVTN